MERNAGIRGARCEVIAFLVSAVALGISIVALAVALTGITPQPRDPRGRFIKRTGNRL